MRKVLRLWDDEGYLMFRIEIHEDGSLSNYPPPYNKDWTVTVTEEPDQTPEGEKP